MSDDLAQEAAVHLRAAALEMITAARALLDLTEQLVKDPAPIVNAVAALAAAASHGPGREPGDQPGAADADPATDRPAPAGSRPRPRSRVQHIRVS